MSDGGIHERCRVLVSANFCPEVDLRLAAAAGMVAAEDWGNAGEMFSIVERIVKVHTEDNELRRGRT